MQRRIPSLDGLRAVSILFVLYGHAVGTVGFPVHGYGLGLAQAGVRIFFIISGFLITGLLLKELEATGKISLKDFYRRRVLRIFPAFYSYWLVIFLLAVSGVLSIPHKYLAYAALYTIDYVTNRPWHLGHLWSLAVEEQFYALWPLTLVFLGRRRAFSIAAGALVLVPPLRLAQFFLFPAHREGISEEFHTIVDCLATGCLLAGWQGWLWERTWYRRFLTSRRFWLAPAAALLTLAGNRHPSVKWLVGIPLFDVAVALCIDRWSRFPKTDLFARFLNLRPVAFIGTLSYSIYLWQQPFMDRYSSALWNRFPLNLALAVMLAFLSYHYIERPFLALRHRSAGIKPAPPPGTEQAPVWPERLPESAGEN